MSLVLTLSSFYTMFSCFCCWLWSNKFRLGYYNQYHPLKKQHYATKLLDNSTIHNRIKNCGARSPCNKHLKRNQVWESQKIKQNQVSNLKHNQTTWAMKMTNNINNFEGWGHTLFAYLKTEYYNNFPSKKYYRYPIKYPPWEVLVNRVFRYFK